MTYFTSNPSEIQIKDLFPGKGYVPYLSKAHIRPFDISEEPNIEYLVGASLIKTSKNKHCPAVGGGARGGIKGFSRQSRRRLLELIASVRRDAELPVFITLTYPDKFPTVERAKRDLKVFEQRIQRRFDRCGGIWKLEPQERGAPHFHLLVWGVDEVVMLGWVVKNWFEIAGDGDLNHFRFHSGLLKGSKPCVSKVKSWRGVWSYAAKYLGKTFEVAGWGKLWTGRFWGVFNRQNINFGEKRVIKTSYRNIVQIMRYQRRYMHMRNNANRDLNSLKTFCDVDQWISKLDLDPGIKVLERFVQDPGRVPVP